MPMLIGARVIQGLGGGTIQSMISIILTESVPISKDPYRMHYWESLIHVVSWVQLLVLQF